MDRADTSCAMDGCAETGEKVNVEDAKGMIFLTRLCERCQRAIEHAPAGAVVDR